MALDAQVSNWLMKYIHKHEIKLRTQIPVIKLELQYFDMTYRNLLNLINFASTSIDNFTNFMSYIDEFCLYLPILIMPFRNRKILCTLHYVIFFWQIDVPTSLLKKSKKKKFEFGAYLNKEDYPIKIFVIVFCQIGFQFSIQLQIVFSNLDKKRS